MIGTLSAPIEGELDFNIDLVNPEGVQLHCFLYQNSLECLTERIIDGITMIMNETIITRNNEEVMIIEEFFSEEAIYCGNYYIDKAAKHLLVPFSFRQVSHLKKNDVDMSFSFYLITLVSKPYVDESFKQGYSINLRMNVPINNMERKKNATCLLEQDITFDDADIVQGTFVCTVKLTSSEYNVTTFENIMLDLENEEINGVSDLDEISLNPYKTDQKIEEIRRKKANNEEVSALENIYDYYEEDIEIVPSFHTTSVNMDTCEDTGVFILTGTFSGDIIEPMKFDLFLSFPQREAKCELEPVKRNEIANMTCKVYLGFQYVEALLVEQIIIKKKGKELLFLEAIEEDFGNDLKGCGDYNSFKAVIVKDRHKSQFSFLQISKFTPRPNIVTFFMALTRKVTTVAFMTSYKISIKLKFSNRRLLRNLEDGWSNNIQAECNLNENLKSELAAGYDCSNSDAITGTPLEMELETPEISNIQGIPENANPNKLKNKVDYSTLENLKTIDNIPIATIQNINGDNCTTDGLYIINAKLDRNANLSDNYSDVNMSIAVPESTSLCKVFINRRDINMFCQNRDKFYRREMLIERQVIQDAEGKEIFFIDSYTLPYNMSFFCDVSVKSETYTAQEKDSYKRYYTKKEGGLSTGALVAIIICVVVVIGIVILLIICLSRRSKISKEVTPENTSSEFWAKSVEI